MLLEASLHSLFVVHMCDVLCLLLVVQLSSFESLPLPWTTYFFMAPIWYEVVMYKSDAALFGVKPHEKDFTHSVLLLRDNDNAMAVLDYRSDGFAVNRHDHLYFGAGWYRCPQAEHYGCVEDDGVFENTTVENIINYVYACGKWTSEQFHSSTHCCLDFVRDVVTWAKERPSHQQAAFLSRFDNTPSDTPIIPHRTPFTERFDHSAIPHTNTTPLPVPVPSTDTVKDLLNATLRAHPNMHFKQELIGALFNHSNLSAKQIHAMVPVVSEATIKKSLGRAQHAMLMPLEVKRMDGHREHVHGWEKKFFRTAMLPFFSSPVSGSRANKAGVAPLRTPLKPLGLYCKYVCYAFERMVEMAKEENEKNKYDILPYPDIMELPRHYEFFRSHLLKPLIHYREERNVKRCHYCLDLEQARADLMKLLKRKDTLSKEEYDQEHEEISARIKKGEHHTERWARQNGYVHEYKKNLQPAQCLIQTDYFSFYSVTAKVNVLAVVLHFFDESNELRVEHVQYVSKHKHDYEFSAVGFEHVFSQVADLVCNKHGPKMTKVVLTGDTAMFKGQFLCCLRDIVTTAGVKDVECIPLCQKHGSNDCDGDGGRVKPMADDQVLKNTFDEKNLAVFCADIVALFSDSNCRAYPITGLIKEKKAHIKEMFPAQDVNSLYPPKRGFGQIKLTGGPAQHHLWCRTDVGVPEPWRLGKLGYPLLPGMTAPTWAFVNMADNPKSQCLPCSAYTMAAVPKGHAGCLFAVFTQYNQCSICLERTGHNKSNCPKKNANKKWTKKELRSVCKGMKLSQLGTEDDMLRRIAEHNGDDDVEAVQMGDCVLLDEDEMESDSELSEEREEEFMFDAVGGRVGK